VTKAVKDFTKLFWLRKSVTEQVDLKCVGSVVSRRGRIIDVVPRVEVGFEPRVKSGERQTAYSDK